MVVDHPERALRAFAPPLLARRVMSATYVDGTLLECSNLPRRPQTTPKTTRGGGMLINTFAQLDWNVPPSF